MLNWWSHIFCYVHLWVVYVLGNPCKCFINLIRKAAQSSAGYSNEWIISHMVDGSQRMAICITSSHRLLYSQCNSCVSTQAAVFKTRRHPVLRNSCSYTTPPRIIIERAQEYTRIILVNNVVQHCVNTVIHQYSNYVLSGRQICSKQQLLICSCP